MRVAEELEIFDLSLHSASHVPADELLAGDDLEGNLLVCAAVNGELHLAEGALAEGPEDVVLADALFGTHLIGKRGRDRGVHGGVHGAVVASMGIAVVIISADLGGRQGDGELLIIIRSRRHGCGWRSVSVRICLILLVGAGDGRRETGERPGVCSGGVEWMCPGVEGKCGRVTSLRLRNDLNSPAVVGLVGPAQVCYQALDSKLTGQFKLKLPGSTEAPLLLLVSNIIHGAQHHQHFSH